MEGNALVEGEDVFEVDAVGIVFVAGEARAVSLAPRVGNVGVVCAASEFEIFDSEVNLVGDSVPAEDDSPALLNNPNNPPILIYTTIRKT